MLQSLNNKTGSEVIQALNTILLQNQQSETIVFDNKREFYNKQIHGFLKEKSIFYKVSQKVEHVFNVLWCIYV